MPIPMTVKELVHHLFFLSRSLKFRVPFPLLSCFLLESTLELDEIGFKVKQIIQNSDTYVPLQVLGHKTSDSYTKSMKLGEQVENTLEDSCYLDKCRYGKTRFEDMP